MSPGLLVVHHCHEPTHARVFDTGCKQGRDVPARGRRVRRQPDGAFADSSHWRSPHQRLAPAAERVCACRDVAVVAVRAGQGLQSYCYSRALLRPLHPRSGDLHWTAVANATRAPMWRESFTFSQGNARARKVVLWVKQCPRGAAAVGSRVYREADPNIGLAMVPLPTDKTPVSVTEWASGELFSGRMVAGWYPIQGPPR